MRSCEYVRKVWACMIMICGYSIAIHGQSASTSMYKGNEAYKEKKFDQAQTEYNKANQKKPSFNGDYNEANALYQQNKYKESAEMNMSALGKAKTDKERAMASFNLGNSFYKVGDFPKAIEAYKQTLRIDPSDLDAKKNLTKALQQKKKQEEQKKNQQNKDQQKQDQNQDQQKKDQQKQDQQNQNDGDQGQNKPPADKDPSKSQQDKPQNLSRQESENLLRIMKQEEQATRAKLMKQQRPQQGNGGKDW